MAMDEETRREFQRLAVGLAELTGEVRTYHSNIDARVKQNEHELRDIVPRVNKIERMWARTAAGAAVIAAVAGVLARFLV